MKFEDIETCCDELIEAVEEWYLSGHSDLMSADDKAYLRESFEGVLEFYGY